MGGDGGVWDPTGSTISQTHRPQFLKSGTPILPVLGNDLLCGITCRIDRFSWKTTLISATKNLVRAVLESVRVRHQNMYWFGLSRTNSPISCSNPTRDGKANLFR